MIEQVWTDARDEQMRAWLREKKTFRQIAELFVAGGFRVSRYACIGRSHRKNMEVFNAPRGSAAGKIAAQARAEENAAAGARRRAAREAEKLEKVVKIPATTKRSPPPEKPAEVITLRAPEPAVPFDPLALIPEPRQCKWIDGDVRARTARLCTETRMPGRSYCQHHHRVAWVPVQKRKPGEPRNEFRLLPPTARRT